MSNVPPPPPGPPGPPEQPPGPPSAPPPAPPSAPPSAPAPGGGWAPPPAAAAQPPMGMTSGGAPASFGVRLGAYLIDGVIQSLMFIPAGIALFAGPTKRVIENCPEYSDFDTSELCIVEKPTGTTWAIFAVLVAVGIVGVLVYRAKTEGKTGQTIGKRVLGIRTVDATTGQPIGGGKAIGRFFCYYISNLVCYLGFLWAIWDANSQAWHDKIVGTVVIKE